MMVDDMCFFHPAIILNIRHHWAPKMTKFNTKPGSSRRCSISGQRDYDSNNAKQGNRDPIDQTFHHSSWLNHDSIMTTWLLDFTILSRKSHAVPKCANPWGLGNVHQFLCCFPCTNVAYRTYRTSTDFTVGSNGSNTYRPMKKPARCGRASPVSPPRPSKDLRWISHHHYLGPEPNRSPWEPWILAPNLPQFSSKYHQNIMNIKQIQESNCMWKYVQSCSI